MHAIRKAFLCLGVGDAHRYTYKAFRAGRATHMVAHGHTLSQTMTDGDWKSRAVFNYIRESDADAQEVISQALEESDDNE